MTQLPHEMVTPAKRAEKYLKELFEKFMKTSLPIPTAVALSAGVYALVLMFAESFCLSGLITPLLMLGIFWKFGIKDVKRLLVIGAVACLAFSGVWTVYFTGFYQHIDQDMARSSDNVLFNGTVTPLFGGKDTVYTYSLEIRLPNSSTPVEQVSVDTASVGFPFAEAKNQSMTLVSHNASTNTSYYEFQTTISKPINQYFFWAKVNNTWFVGTEHKEGQEYVLIGPVFTNSWAVAGSLAPISLIQAFIAVFPIYALLLLMVWWTRRARRMRVEAYERAVVEREQETKDVPKDEGKVPSLAKATGVEKGEGFVCSECGADVPADATVCPKCGEKFD